MQTATIKDLSNENVYRCKIEWSNAKNLVICIRVDAAITSSELYYNKKKGTEL